MVNHRFTGLNSLVLALPAVLVLALLAAMGWHLWDSKNRAEAARLAQVRAASAKPAPKEPPPPVLIEPPAVEDVLRQGTLIVISKKSQQMFVFSNGKLWATSPVSTGRRRHATPSGVFPILQKRRFHRSNIYSGAPMPFMQRLTWSGIAIHAGHVPGYPASHGCVRVPRAFAMSLFKLTNFSATTVVIGDEPLDTERRAEQFALNNALKKYTQLVPHDDPRAVALASKAAVPRGPAIAGATPPSPMPLSPPPSPPPPPPPLPPPPAAAATLASATPPAGKTGAPHGQTIQLTAAASAAEAEAHWARLLRSRPELRRFEKRVEAAVVNSRQVYRLRASSSDAHSYCSVLKSAGISCFNVS